MKKSDLSVSRRELLNKWLGGKVTSEPFHIPKRRDPEDVKLSFTQQRQLFLELLRPGTAVNNLSIGIELKGNLDLNALQKSADMILSRHEILRLRYRLDHGLPVGEIVSEVKVEIPIVSMDGEDAMRAAREMAAQPFELSAAPLMRLRLFKLKEDRHLMILVIHHTIADGWSLGIFLKELTEIYQSIIGGYPAALPELPVQYPDFSEWQFNLEKENSFEQDIAYWKNQLGGELPVLQLPADRMRPAHQTFAGSTHQFVIHQSVVNQLETIGQENDSTLFMTLLTAYVTFLHRYTNQEDILVGTPTAGRNLPELNGIIGPFINTLALRIDVSENPTITELLKRVRSTALEAYSHQDIPFEKIVEELKPKRDLSHAPIFQTVFNLRNAPMPDIGGGDLEIQTIEINRSVSEMDLTLMIAYSDGNYVGVVEYSRDLFDSITIERMFQQFQGLLLEIINNPKTSISNLHLGSDSDRTFSDTNQIPIEYPRKKRTHQLFEENALKNPDAISVIFGGTSLTYSELNKRANAVASLLQSKGMRRGDRIGVCMQRSLEIPEVLLGIHKAGCIYVPVHPSSPTARMQFIVADANLRLIFSNIDLAIDEVPVQSTSALVKLNDYSYDPSYASHPDTDELAYIIYTSGSTGNPKGVMIPHTALTNLLWSIKERPGTRPHDVLLSVTSITFDIAALELFTPLITGATVIIASDEMIYNPVELANAIDKNKVTIMQATPAVWQLVIDSGWTGNPGLKALCGGDVLTTRLAERLVNMTGELWNMYGPTETTIWSTMCKVKSSTSISIGQPIHNTQTYILDRNLTPTPAGVYGELCIGGEGLAVGYLNNDELTNQKFITVVTKSGAKLRLFKTGDKARYLADNSIELLGRFDDQVKVYGHRIDLNEVKDALLDHPSIGSAVVISRSNGDNKVNLVAYYVLRDSIYITKDEIRGFVKEKLPGYMVPNEYIPLETLPLTPNGKVDRKALPEPSEVPDAPDYTPPRTESEKILVDIWQDILALERVGIHDNFFDLGGASIQSIQIVTSASKSGLQFNPEDIFECQTIFELARKL